MADVQIKINDFEGPFDLLLSLLEKKKMDITDISISEIADTYLEIIFQEGFDIETGSEFLVVASTLIKMKSQKLLPKVETEDPEELTEEELARRLIIYKRFKELAVGLNALSEKWQGAMYKMPEILSFAKRPIETKADPALLAESYARMINTSDERFADNSVKMETILKVEKVSLKEKIRQVFNFIKDKVKAKFSEIFTNDCSKAEKITGFVAVLELAKRDKVKVRQKKIFGEIDISKRKDAELSDLTVSEDFNEWK